VIFSYEGCLECGTCRMVCSFHAVNWSYPKQGNGVLYRFG
jgi:ferredoxin like protein